MFNVLLVYTLTVLIFGLSVAVYCLYVVSRQGHLMDIEGAE